MPARPQPQRTPGPPQIHPGSSHRAPCDYLPNWHPRTPSPPPHVFFNPYRFPLLVFLPVDATQTWREKKPGGGVRRDCGAIARENKNEPRFDGSSSSEVAATADCDRARRQDEGRRDEGRLHKRRDALPLPPRALAAEVRWLSEVQERKSRPAAGRKHHGKPDELALSNPCRDTRSRSLARSFAPSPNRSLGGVLPRIRALFISASAAHAESLISIRARRL